MRLLRLRLRSSSRRWRRISSWRMSQHHYSESRNWETTTIIIVNPGKIGYSSCTDSFILRNQVNKPVPPGPMMMVVVVSPEELAGEVILPLAGAMPLMILFFSISLRLRSAFSSGVSFILLILTRSLSRARRIRLCSGSSCALAYLKRQFNSWIFYSKHLWEIQKWFT